MSSTQQYLLALAGALVAAWAVRQTRIHWFKRELYHQVDPIIEADRGEGYLRDRSKVERRRRMRRGADDTFMPTRAGAATIWWFVRMRMRPRFNVWPRLHDVREVTIVIPRRTLLHEVEERLTETVAEWLEVPITQLNVRRHRSLSLGRSIQYLL